MGRKVTILLVPYKNTSDFKEVFLDIVTKTNFPKEDLELLVIDNNIDKGEFGAIQEILEPHRRNFTIRYHLNENHGSLAGATNLGIGMASGDLLVYVCSSHAYIYNKEWLNNMLDNFTEEDIENGYVMGGTLAPWQTTVHVQGSIFISSTTILRHHMYGVAKYPFSFMDVLWCTTMMNKGFKLKAIPKMLGLMGRIPIADHLNYQQNQQCYIVHAHNMPDFRRSESGRR